MKRTLLAIASIAAGFAVSGPAIADLQLATTKNCMACHAVDKKLVGHRTKMLLPNTRARQTLPTSLKQKS